MPAALVASLGRASRSGRNRKRRSGLGSISVPNPLEHLPNPVESALSSRRRRRRRAKMMKLARNAGAVVSAVTFAADLAGTIRDLSGPGNAGGTASPPAPPGRSGTGRRPRPDHGAAQPNGAGSRRTPARGTGDEPGSGAPSRRAPSARSRNSSTATGRRTSTRAANGSPTPASKKE